MEIFKRKWSALSGRRFDAEYYKNNDIKIKTYPLKNIILIRSGKRIPKGKTYAINTTSYKYLRVDDLNSNITELDIDNLKSIDKDIFDLLKRYEIHNNEIALSIAGTIGKIFLFQNNTENKVILTENCVKLQMRSDDISPKFLSLVLKTDFLQNQMKRQYIQTTIPKLAIERVKELKIPSIPPLETQQHIIDIMDNAYSLKKQKEQEAKELLDSIDKYLLDELGITLPNPQTHLQNRIWTAKFSELSGARFDPSYHQSYYKQLELALENGKYHLRQLGEIANFIASGSTPKSKGKDYEENGKYHFLRLVDFDSSFGINLQNVIFVKEYIYNGELSRVRLKKGDILFGIAGSLGKVAQYNYNFLAVVNQAIAVLRFKDNILNEFILYVLSSSIIKNQIERLKRPVAQPNINIQELKSFKIPLPPLAIQEKIAEEIQKRKQKALKLTEEAKGLLEQAKKQVESMILGE